MAIAIAQRYSNATKPCPVCGTGTKGCSSTADGFHFCRGEEPLPGWEQLGQGADSAGFFHYRRADDERRNSKSRDQWNWLNDETNWGRKRLATPPRLAEIADSPVKDWGALAKTLSTGFTTRRREELARILRLPVDSLAAFPLLGYVQQAELIDGVPVEKGYWTFSEVDAESGVVGILCRWRNGHGPDGKDKQQKFGSGRGLTMPVGYHERPGPAISVEGQTNTIAMHKAGFAVNGRPGASAGGEMLAKLYADLDPNRDIIIVGDNDEKANGKWPGKEGAIAIARKVSQANGRLVKWALPPTGFKDVREYLTADFWSNTPFEARGEKLRDHFEATAVTVESNAHTPAPVCGKPNARPAPCPFTASQDMRDEISLSTCRCPNQSSVRFQKGDIRFVAYRDCGNGTDCRACLQKRLYKLLKMSDSYLIRTSVTVEETETNKPRIVYGAILPTGPTSAMKKKVQRRGGERVSILTEDAHAVAVLLAGEGAAENDASRFFLEEYVEESLGRIGTFDPQSSQSHLWLLSLPVGMEPPAGFHVVTVAAAIRAMMHAVNTVPVPEEGTTCYKPTHKSVGWGDEEEKYPTETKCLGPSAFSPVEVTEILNAVNVDVVRVQFDSKKTRTTGVGWALPAVQSAALNIWVGGTAAPSRPDVARVTELAQHWLPQLASLGHTVGQGSRVQEILRDEIWYCGIYEIADKLRAADEQDKAEESFTCEAESILRSLREQYRGREHEAVGVVAFLLA